MSRFVRPESVVLPISNGDTLTVKRRLTTGETREAYARMYYVTDDGTVRVDPLKTGVAQITAYLLDWTLTDDSGAVVPIRGLRPEEVEQVLNQLDHADFTEIRLAIVAHEERMTAERDQQKKTRGGVNGGETTSLSPSALVGVSSGSVS